MGRLGVYFGGQSLGTVVDEGGRFSFEYEPNWLADRAPFPISQSLPLVPGPQTGEPAHAFFANLLPEGRVRSLVAQRLGISESNDFGLLAALGGECAGALVLANAPPDASEQHYRPIDEGELARLARSGGAFAETSGSGGVRLSLAGAQDKLPVRVDGAEISLPLGSSPSTHILKFASRDWKHLPANEALIRGPGAVERPASGDLRASADGEGEASVGRTLRPPRRG